MQSQNSADVRDGGYGWVLALSLGLTMMLGSAPLSMFSVIFKDVLEEDGISSERIMAVLSVFTATQALQAFSIQFFIKRFGLRHVAFTGAVLFGAGNLSSSFAQNFTLLFISYGVITGSGYGLAAFCSTTCVVEYFSRLRTVAFSLCHVINLIGSLLCPLLVENLLIIYGRTGTQLIITAIGFHAIPAALLLRKVRRRRLNLEDESFLEKRRNEKKENSEECMKRSAEHSCCVRLSRLDQVRLLKDPFFLLTTLVMSMATASDSTFFSLLPPFLMVHHALSLHDATKIVIATSGGDLAGRCLLMVLGKSLATKNRQVFWFSMASTAAALVVTSVARDYSILTAMAALIGGLRGLMYVSYTLVYAQHYSSEVFPAAYGTALIITAITYASFGPLLGSIRDITGSYVTTYLTVAAILIVCCGLWLLDTVVRRTRRSWDAENVTQTQKAVLLVNFKRDLTN